MPKPEPVRPKQPDDPLWARIGLVLLLVAGVYSLYFSGLSAVGILGPDEPRYASIGREMARSGDWVTPRLWGEAWFEKPPLLYWMIGLAFRLGFNDDLAPRVPVALLGAGFLLFYFYTLRREFDSRTAWFSAAILGASVGWIAFSRAAATDLPLTVSFSAAMLLCLPWIARGDRRQITPAAAMFGFAVLAKGLVPIVLAAPVAGLAVWKIFSAHRERRLPILQIRDWLRPGPILAFLAVTAPWYVAIILRHGNEFIEEFFLRHHFGRFYSDALQHAQPVWFYIPVLLAGLFPWTPLIVLLFRRSLFAEVKIQFFLVWFGFGFLFFSASVNKLPGYLLPLFPAIAALLGVALAREKTRRWPLAAAALLLALIPVAIEVLPAALLAGITSARIAGIDWRFVLLAAILAGLVWREQGKQRERALAWVVAATVAGILLLEARTFSVLDRTVSVRGFWRTVEDKSSALCIGDIHRARRYGLNYYSEDLLPDCRDDRYRVRIEEVSRSLVLTSPEAEITEKGKAGLASGGP